MSGDPNTRCGVVSFRQGHRNRADDRGKARPSEIQLGCHWASGFYDNDVVDIAPLLSGARGGKLEILAVAMSISERAVCPVGRGYAWLLPA